jgi:hypothetical protein
MNLVIMQFFLTFSLTSKYSPQHILLRHTILHLLTLGQDSQPFQTWGHIHPFLSTCGPQGYKWQFIEMPCKFIKNASNFLLYEHVHFF